MIADSTVLFALDAEGLSYGDTDRRAAYLEACYPHDSATDAADMGRSQSACLLFARGCLSRQRRADGTPEIPGQITWRGGPFDALRTPYAKTIGQIEVLLYEWAKQRGHLHAALWQGDATATGAEIPPEIVPGDIVVVGSLSVPPQIEPHRTTWARTWGGVTHGFVVTGVSGREVESVDGGQTDERNSYKPTAIRARSRRLERKDSGWWLGDRRLNYLVRVP